MINVDRKTKIRYWIFLAIGDICNNKKTAATVILRLLAERNTDKC